MNFAPARLYPGKASRSSRQRGGKQHCGCVSGGLPLVEGLDPQSATRVRQYRLRTKAPPTSATGGAYPEAIAAGKPRKKDRKAEPAFPQTLREKQTQMREGKERWPRD